MFESDKLIFVQMQKTGSTHIAKLLAELFNAGPINESVGKHESATEKQLGTGKLIASSIRNPWDWYVSLWTFGTEGKGGLRNRLLGQHNAQPAPPSSSSSALGSATDSSPAPDSLSEKTPTNAVVWQKVYEDKSCVQSFRKWLQLVHDPVNSYQMGEGYGQSGLAHLCGFMTYRHLRLCCRIPEGTNSLALISSHAELVAYDLQHCYVNYFIRQESLENDLCNVIDRVHPLSMQQRARIYGATRTNQSSRSFSTAHYYDRDSIDLVEKREEFIANKFGYSSPKLLPPNAGTSE